MPGAPAEVRSLRCSPFFSGTLAVAREKDGAICGECRRARSARDAGCSASAENRVPRAAELVQLGTGELAVNRSRMTALWVTRAAPSRSRVRTACRWLDAVRARAGGHRALGGGGPPVLGDRRRRRCRSRPPGRRREPQAGPQPVFGLLRVPSTYSWPESSIIAYMISSVIARQTKRSAPCRLPGEIKRLAEPDAGPDPQPWPQPAGGHELECPDHRGRITGTPDSRRAGPRRSSR